MKNIVEANEFKRRSRKGDIIPVIFGVDIDGVQNDFVNGFFDVYQKYFPNKEFERDIDEWYFYQKVDLDGANPDDFFMKTKGETWQYSKPYPGVPETMRMIYEWCKDNDLILKIVTSQPTKEAQEGAIEWLAKYNIPYDDIVFTRSRSKFNHCDILIDDSHKVLNSKPDNKVSIKVRRKWNENVKSDFEIDGLNNITTQILDDSLQLYNSRK